MFGQAIIWYLFLGGLGSGMMAVLCLCDLLGAHVRPAASARVSAGAASATCPALFPRALFSRGLLAATIVLLAGLSCLMADLGRPERFFYVIVHPTPSVLTFGSYVLGTTLLSATALCALGFARISGPRALLLVRVLEVAGAVGSILTMAYTGVLLSQMGVVALWANPLLAPLFVASALSTGLAGTLVCLAPLDEAPRRVVRLLARADLVAVVLEIVLLAAYLGFAVAAGDGGLVARGLLAGSRAGLFWGGFVAPALLAPLALEAVHACTGWTAPLLVAAACVIIGGYFLRYCIVNVPVV